jgi:hypothetical protein
MLVLLADFEKTRFLRLRQDSLRGRIVLLAALAADKVVFENLHRRIVARSAQWRSTVTDVPTVQSIGNMSHFLYDATQLPHST